MTDWLARTVRTAGVERALKAGQVLFRAGQRTTGLFEVTSGSVRLVRVDRTGRETVLYVAVSGETLAEASLFASVYHCDAVAVTDAVVRRYPRDKVLGEFKRNPAVAQAFMAMLAQRIMDLRAMPRTTQYSLCPRSRVALFRAQRRSRRMHRQSAGNTQGPCGRTRSYP